MTEVFRQAQVLLVHPLSHAFLALVLFCTALFPLMRRYYSTRLFKHAAIPAAGLCVLACMAAQLGVVYATKPPHYWLFGRDLPVYVLLAVAVAFAVLGVIELMARHQWQGYTNLTLMAGTLALDAGTLKYAYAWPNTLASILVFLMLLVAIAMAIAATRYPHKWAPPASEQLHRA